MACRRHAPGRDRSHLLGFGPDLRHATGHPVEECLERGQPLVARSDMVVPLLLDECEELENPCRRQVVGGQSGEPATTVIGHESQEQQQGVPIAANGGGTQALLRLEMILEVSVEQAAQGWRGHGRTSSSIGAA